MSDPIVVPQAVVLFQLNGLSDVESAMPARVEVEYARLALPSDMDPAVIRAQTDDCGDLYPLARGLPAEALQVVTQDMGAVPQDIGLVGLITNRFVSLVTPGISSVDQPAFELGKAAAKLFIETMHNESDMSHVEEVLKVKLIVRESSQRIVPKNGRTK